MLGHMSDMLGHDLPHFDDNGLCECDCAECRTRFERTVTKGRRGPVDTMRAKCICRGCAHNTAEWKAGRPSSDGRVLVGAGNR